MDTRSYYLCLAFLFVFIFFIELDCVLGVSKNKIGFISWQFQGFVCVVLPLSAFVDKYFVSDLTLLFRSAWDVVVFNPDSNVESSESSLRSSVLSSIIPLTA